MSIAICAAASLSLHALLLDAMMGSGAHRTRTSPAAKLGAADVQSEEESRATLIFLDMPSTARTNEEIADSVASRGGQITPAFLTVIRAEPIREPHAELGDAENDDAAVPDSADEQGRAKQFGMYLGQIQARIQRAWMRPRDSLGGMRFECSVQILQNVEREVLEVVLQRCNGTANWQVSLVHAIERASPLPAPPEPVLFSESVRLAFSADEYVPGEREQGYELINVAPIVARQAAVLVAPQISSEFEAPQVHGAASPPDASAPPESWESN